MKENIPTASLIFKLITFHLCGWKQVSGYTVMEKEPDGSVYFAIHLKPPSELQPSRPTLRTYEKE